MNILGIETSCDETSAAIVKDGRKILSNVVISSLKEHKRYGGVIPEIASRRQLECINPVVEKALFDARINLNDIDAVAVTYSPGLIGSLLVGISFSRALAFAVKRHWLKVDHIKAHLYACFLQDGTNRLIPKLPAIGLVVSGGHTSLYYIKDFNKFILIGQTLDDAAGESFDKVSRILGLGYPGGPVIEKRAKRCKYVNLRFNCAKLPGTLDFSFSGIKTGVLYYVRDNNIGKEDTKKINEIAAAFQRSIVSVLVEKSMAACDRFKVKTMVVGGGVAANSFLREVFIREAYSRNIKIFFPPLALCMDNAAMVAGLGYHILKK